MAGQGVHVSRP